jgi:hypothetical protein
MKQHHKDFRDDLLVPHRLRWQSASLSGQGFAYQEMKVVLARLVQQFDLELLDRDPQPVAGPKSKRPCSPCRNPVRRRANRPRPTVPAVRAST